MPLRRYIFNTLTVVSLLLPLGVMGLWVFVIWVNALGRETLVTLVPVFSILPAIWLTSWFFKWQNQRRLAKVGKCPSCGYDLTGNETGVCPECGATGVAETRTI